MEMNGTNQSAPTNGYDLPLYGLGTEHFYRIHIPALAAIFTSLSCVLILLIASFTYQNRANFFKWSKSERLVVYLALCDGLFNTVHSMDHIQILLTEKHVLPPQLCEFYAAMIIEFVSAQQIMVCIICVNAFLLVFFQRNIKFGRYDWKLLLAVLGIPLLIIVATIFADVLGPQGAFCYFDSIKGQSAFVYLHTVPVIVIITMVTLLYTSTWLQIRHTENKIRDFKIQSRKDARNIRSSNRAARNMSLFVIALIVQWAPSAVFGVWQLTQKALPHFMFQFLTFFPNIGGVLNLLVYVIIRRRFKRHGTDSQFEEWGGSSTTRVFRPRGGGGSNHVMKIVPDERESLRNSINVPTME